MRREFTGRHMAAILIGFFGLVIGVNVTMAVFASSTFGGTVVDNSYVASQKFNGWIEKGRAQAALGWTMTPARLADGRVALVLADDAGALTGATLEAAARHPLGRVPDTVLRFHEIAPGRYVSDAALAEGRWHLHVAAQASGATVNRIVPLS